MFAISLEYICVSYFCICVVVVVDGSSSCRFLFFTFAHHSLQNELYRLPHVCNYMFAYITATSTKRFQPMRRLHFAFGLLVYLFVEPSVFLQFPLFFSFISSSIFILIRFRGVQVCVRLEDATQWIWYATEFYSRLCTKRLLIRVLPGPQPYISRSLFLPLSIFVSFTLFLMFVIGVQSRRLYLSKRRCRKGNVHCKTRPIICCGRRWCHRTGNTWRWIGVWWSVCARYSWK